MMRGKFEKEKNPWAVYAGIVLLGTMLFLAGCGMRDAALAIPATREGGQAKEPGDENVPNGTDETIPKEPEEGLISVYVCGAVASPGVVELPEGSRAADALQAAGGFAEDAETSYVNLAAKVTDGEKLYFPNVAEGVTLREQEKGLGLVNINTAGLEELCTLPGIGEARAAGIIAYREANGLFGDKEDIMRVSGIKESAYAKICEKITVQ